MATLLPVAQRKAAAELVPVNFKVYRSIVEALDEIVAARQTADPFTPVTRTDVVRESLVRTIREFRAPKVG